MGTSSNRGKKQILDWVSDHRGQINSILDIGSGSGTYYDLLSPIKKFNWEAIEIWQPYIDKFFLENKYSTVYNIDIKNFTFFKSYDLIIAGDILEHLSKDDAIVIVENCLNNSKNLIISIPIIHYPQGAENGNPYEIHIKDDWSDSEIKDTFSKYIKKSKIDKEIGVYWLEK
jgi:SAM-dependent methyltransferase